MSTRIISNNIKLRLLYWNIRGRIQAVRYMLEDIAYKHKNVDYKESYEPIDTVMNTWAKKKDDQTVSGPFRILPVLHWNDKHTFSQSLTIGQLVAKKFDLYGKLTLKVNDKVFLETYIDARDYSKKFLPNEENCQSLTKLEHVMRERPAVANCFDQGLLSKRFTCSSKEIEYLATLTETLKLLKSDKTSV